LRGRAAQAQRCALFLVLRGLNLAKETRLALVFLFTVLTTGFNAVLASQPEVNSDEYNVYSALLAQSYISKGETQLVIEDHTQDTRVFYDDDVASHFSYVRKRLPTLSQDTINDFRRKNNGSQILNRSFNLRIKYVLISKTRFEGFAGPNERMEMSRVGWEAFYREYRGASGFILLSRVGFDRKKSQALVFITHMRGNPSGRWWGEGSYVLLSKKNGHWRVRRRTVILTD
jgi:hypothetical protein